MRKLIFLSLMIIGCASAADTNPHIAAIERKIEQNALGMDIGYQAGKLDTVVIVTAQDGVKDMEAKTGMDISGDYNKAIEHFTGVYKQAQAEHDVYTYHIWKWEVDRLQRLSKAAPGDIDYSVYKYTYTINNVFEKGKRATVSNYYFFDHNDSLAGMVGEDEMADLKTELIESELHPYEMALISLQTGLEL